MKSVSLAKDVRKAVRRGHPWLFDGAVHATGIGPGELVRVEDLGVGWFDPYSPIRVRFLPGFGDGDWVTRTVRRAVDMRRCHPRLSSRTALRMIHGEADGLPGLVVDQYNDFAVVKFDGAAAASFWGPQLPAVFDTLGVAGLWVKGGQGHLGEAPPERVVIREDGVEFAIDVRRGHKTGWFLDHYESRLDVRSRSAGKRVLDLFGYAGGFSVHAAVGGATSVTLVDAAGPAVKQAQDNAQRNGVSVACVKSDVFDFMENTQERFDLVVCDPPSFAPRKKSREPALKAYERVNAAALAVLADGGLLCTASCSSHITEADLEVCVARAAGDRPLRIVARGVAGPDHPTLPGFFEGNYLAYLVCTRL